MPAGNPEPEADSVAAGNMNPECLVRTKELNHDFEPGKPRQLIGGRSMPHRRCVRNAMFRIDMGKCEASNVASLKNQGE
jgi:hypothetical protein